jgi:hypothetical protein
MRSNPLPAVTWGGGHVPSKTPADARSRGALTDDEFATAQARLVGG